MTDVIIIGGGITGLSCGYFLKQSGRSVTVLEASPEVGGMIRSVSSNGYLLEYGPNSFRGDSPEFARMIGELNLTKEIITPASQRIKSFIAARGSLFPVPRSPIELLSSKLLSGSGKLRLLKEPFLRNSSNESDESVASFFSRRIGVEATEMLIKPMIGGIYAGDAEQLSAQSAFPNFFGYEKEYASILRGALRSKRVKRPDLPKVFSFTNGVGMLPLALQQSLGESLKINTPVVNIARQDKLWRVATRSNEIFEAPSVIVTTPLYQAAAMFDDKIIPSEMIIDYPPLAVVHLGYNNTDFKTIPNGFGFLTTPSKNDPMLGCIFVSSLFPRRSPEGYFLCTVLLGGALHLEVASFDRSRLIQMAHDSISKYLDIKPAPSFSEAVVISQSIPQYNMGHGATIERLAQIEMSNQGMYFQGNYRGGVSVGNCISQAARVSEKLISGKYF